MVLKIAAIVALVVCGLFFVSEPHALAAGRALDRPVSLDLLTGVGAALTPVMFAYGGWQTASFVAGGVGGARPGLPRGLLLRVLGGVPVFPPRHLPWPRA